MLKEKKLIYLASPYTHKDKRVMKLRFDQVTAIAAHLVREGHVVFSPITYGHTLCEFEDLPVEFEFWNDFCLKFLEKSDLFVRLEFDGWEESKGLKEEVKFCKENKIPQYLIPPRDGEFQLDRISKSIESALSLIELKDFALDFGCGHSTTSYIYAYDIMRNRIEELIKEEMSNIGTAYPKDFYVPVQTLSVRDVKEIMRDWQQNPKNWYTVANPPTMVEVDRLESLVLLLHRYSPASKTSDPVKYNSVLGEIKSHLEKETDMLFSLHFNFIPKEYL